MNHRLSMELDRVASRYRRLRYWRALAAAWFLAALVGLAVWGLGRALGSALYLSVPALCVLAVALAGMCIWLAALFAPGRKWIALRVEAGFPELESRLLAAMEQQPALADGRFGYLQTSVIREALDHARRHEWPQVVPPRRMALAVAAQFFALGLFFLSLVATTSWLAPSVVAAARETIEHENASAEFSVTVEPGDAEIERGTSLLVLARVAGRMPADGAVVFHPQSGEATRLAMSLSLKDPVFGGRIPSVSEPLDYRVELDGRSTPTYHVTVFEYPRLERADVRLVFPGYTRLEERLVQDFRSVTVVEGTQATVLCRLNKRVASARLVETEAAPAIELAVPDPEQPLYSTTILCDRSRRLKLELVDDAGRGNIQYSELAIHVVPNQLPVLKPVFPARDVDVSPLEELEIKATAWDDFGLVRTGVTYGLAGQPATEVVLAENAAARERHNLAQMLRLEDLKAHPDELLAYHFWAEDFGPDGKVRRSESDMYFAEVRHFEEVFRQGQQPAGGEQMGQGQQGGGANARAAQELSELQKQIINATWKIIRREIGATVSDSFAPDVGEVAQSQSSAREQAEKLGEKLQDGESLGHLASVLEEMERACEQLEQAEEALSAEPLRPALAAEQSAYQALLKLRAREHEVTRRQRQSGGGGGGARSAQQRQQLNQLEMKQEENRYETQRMARSQAEREEDRETRQVLSRLSELARRQHDLNDRLKELQSALAEAATAEQKDEIKRQLKRLQEEQQQVLRDTDELRDRMEAPENMERMSAEREQLEQTRDEVRRASESLEQERVSQAAASGTRAERDFDELRNEFRRRASGRFNDRMREMRDAARELDSREQEIGERLSQTAQADSTSKSLRHEDRRDEIAEGLAEQRSRLSGLVDQMRETIQEAEQTEPLLSERLYDLARDLQNRDPARALQAAEGSLRQGLDGDARKLEEAARGEIGRLREGVERAAETVLGDETEALRRAREELRNLSNELNQEISRNAREEGRRLEAAAERSRQQAAQREEGQHADGSRGDGQQQADSQSERAQGESESGQPSSEPQAAESQPGAQGQQGDDANGGQEGGRQPGQRQRGGQGQNRDGANVGRDGEPSADGQQDPTAPGRRGRGRPGPRQGARRLGGPSGGGDIPDGEPPSRAFSPIFGNDFIDWSDRLRDVEEMVNDPELRAEAARIRDRARGIRAEVKRHSAAPNWKLVRVQVAEPLVELSDRVSEELLRRTSKQAIVPLDRDPVPPRYSEKTRRYYEHLGSGR